MAREGFRANVLTSPNLGVTVRETTAGEAEADIGLWSKRLPDAQFGIQIRRGNHQPASPIRADESRMVVIIKGVARERTATFERLGVPHLDQLPGFRIDLCPNQRSPEQAEKGGRETKPEAAS